MNDTVTAAPVTAAADPSGEEWRTYDEFAAGIDIYRLPNAVLWKGRLSSSTGDDGTVLDLAFYRRTGHVECAGPAMLTEDGATDPYDAVAVRDDVLFVNLPLDVPRADPAHGRLLHADPPRGRDPLCTSRRRRARERPQVTQQFVAATHRRGRPLRRGARGEPRPDRRAQPLPLQPGAPLRARLPLQPAVLLAVPRGRAARTRRHRTCRRSGSSTTASTFSASASSGSRSPVCGSTTSATSSGRPGYSSGSTVRARPSTPEPAATSPSSARWSTPTPSRSEVPHDSDSVDRATRE